MNVRSTNTKNHLNKILGLSFGIAIVIGGTIGVGILRTPGNIAALVPNFWLIMLCWIIGGIFILLGANAYSELSTMIPKAGGSYNFIKRAFGNYAGFVSSWFDYINYAITPAFFCIVISEYISILIPELQKYNSLIAILFLSLITILHITGIKSGSVLQQITSVIKVLFFIVLISACYILGGEAHLTIKQSATNTEVLFNGTLIISFFRALQLIIGTYDGWLSPSFFAEEDSNAKKNIPKALFTGSILVIIIYLLTNIAMLYVLPISVLSKSTLAASDAASIVFGNSGAVFITLLSIFSLISILNACMMIPTRILYGMSRDRYFIPQGAIVNKGGTPVFALLILFVLSIFLILFSSFETLFSLAAFLSVIVTGAAFVSLIKLRKKEPTLNRPYRAWGFPYSIYLVIIISIIILVGFCISDIKSFITVLIIGAISYPAFKFLNFKRNSADKVNI